MTALAESEAAREAWLPAHERQRLEREREARDREATEDLRRWRVERREDRPQFVADARAEREALRAVEAIRQAAENEALARRERDARGRDASMQEAREQSERDQQMRDREATEGLRAWRERTKRERAKALATQQAASASRAAKEVRARDRDVRRRLVAEREARKREARAEEARERSARSQAAVHRKATEDLRGWHEQAKREREAAVLAEARARVEMDAREIAARERAEVGAREREWHDWNVRHAGLLKLYLGGANPSGFPVLWSWLQWLGSAEFVGDDVTANYAAHIDVQPREVQLLPYETCAALLAGPGSWNVQSVVPDGISPSHDAPTSLDQMFAASNVVWGIDGTGQPYFQPSGADAADIAHLFVDVSGQPYLRSDGGL